MLQLDWNVIMASAIIVIGLTEYVKSWDREEKLKKLYKLVPLVLSFVVSLVIAFVQGFTVGSFIFGGLLTLAFSVIGYEAILKFVQSIVDKLKISE